MKIIEISIEKSVIKMKLKDQGLKLNWHKYEGLYHIFRQQKRENGEERKTVQRWLHDHIWSTCAACGVREHGGEIDDTTAD